MNVKVAWSIAFVTLAKIIRGRLSDGKRKYTKEMQGTITITSKSATFDDVTEKSKSRIKKGSGGLDHPIGVPREKGTLAGAFFRERKKTTA